MSRRRTKLLSSLDDLVFDDKNANRGTTRGRRALAESLRRHGAARGVLVDEDGRIIAGNKTVEQAKALGLPLRVVQTNGDELVAVQRCDLNLDTDPEARALAIQDNRVAELDLAWDVDVLKQLRDDGLDLSEFWTDAEFAALLTDASPGLTDDDAGVALRPTTIRRGDLFRLGRHWLLCGSATVATDVSRLLRDLIPLLMMADPPYGVNYDPAWRQGINPGQRTTVGRVTNDDRADWLAAWQLFPGSVAYVWHAALHACTVAADLTAAGFTIRSQIIWRKQHFALSRGDFHWAHEPAWYAVRKGATSHWCGDRAQPTVWEVPNLNPMGGTRTAENTVTGHGTQKPVALYERCLRNHTTDRDALYDPFCGSGTALIAAERTGRTCLAMDINPRCVQATIDRWEAYTGNEAESVDPRAASRSAP